MSNNQSRILHQVRESYRFLFEYQTKVLNLMKYVGRKFTVTYIGGYSKFSNVTPRNGKGSLDFWAWDWLNLYFYEFHFGFYDRNMKNVGIKSLSDRTEDYFGLSVFHIADDGYFLNHLEPSSNADRITVDSFSPVDQSNTKLIFVASKNLWDTEWWHHPKNGNSAQKDFITKEFDVKYGRDKVGDKVMVFKAFDLALFFEEDSALKCLQEFESLCGSHDIVFKLYKNNPLKED